jgi:hypothetical protein
MYEVRDESGTLLLLATTPTRFVRLILEVVGAAVAGAVCGTVCGMLLHFGLKPLQWDGPWPVALFSMLIMFLSGMWAFNLILKPGRVTVRDADADNGDGALLELHPHRSGLRCEVTYDVRDADGIELGKLTSSHIHSLIRRRWEGTRAPDDWIGGEPWFVAGEQSTVPRIARTTFLHNIAIGLGIVLAIAGLWVIFRALPDWPFLTDLALGGLLTALIAYVAAIKKIQAAAYPDCDIVQAGDSVRLGSVLGRQDSQSDRILDLQADPQRTLDRRVAVALAILTCGHE